MDQNNLNKNETIPTEQKEQAGRGRTRGPLVLPEEDYPVRRRPEVRPDQLKQQTEGRQRPQINPEEIHTNEERQVHDGRITGQRHSDATTAAPVRTRTPEQNRNVTNGIPTRQSHMGTGQTAGEVKQDKTRNTLIALVIASVCVILMMSAVVFFVNRSLQPDPSRPADFVDTEGNDEVPSISDVGKAGEEPQSEATESSPGEGDEPATAANPDETESPDPGESIESAETEPAPPETQTETEPETEPEPERYTVTLKFYNRDPITVTTESITVGELLALAGYELKDTDRMYIDTESVITEDTTIDVDTVEYKTVTETVTIPYGSTINEIQTIPRGETNYYQYGQNGEKTLTYTVETVNGKEISRTLSGETVTKDPVDEIYDLGVGGSFVGADGVTYTYSHYRVVPATYYDIEGLTWAGTYASENTIAADFDYLPLGTKVYVKNDKFDFGVRTVEDCGSMVNEWEIDIWIGDDNPQKADFAYIGYHWDMVIYYID